MTLQHKLNQIIFTDFLNLKYKVMSPTTTKKSENKSPADSYDLSGWWYDTKLADKVTKSTDEQPSLAV